MVQYILKFFLNEFKIIQIIKEAKPTTTANSTEPIGFLYCITF